MPGGGCYALVSSERAAVCPFGQRLVMKPYMLGKLSVEWVVARTEKR